MCIADTDDLDVLHHWMLYQATGAAHDGCETVFNHP